MIHISELSWRWVSTPDKVVQPGMFVRVKVVAVDKGKARINLSLKQMEVREGVGGCIEDVVLRVLC